jgi:hypothetical protein
LSHLKMDGKFSMSSALTHSSSATPYGAPYVIRYVV